MTWFLINMLLASAFVASIVGNYLLFRYAYRTKKAQSEADKYIPINTMADLQAVNDILGRGDELPIAYGEMDLPDPNTASWREVPYGNN